VGVVHIYFHTREDIRLTKINEAFCVREDGRENEIGMDMFGEFEKAWTEEVEDGVKRFMIG
jgi:hypothetical protein